MLSCSFDRAVWCKAFGSVFASGLGLKEAAGAAGCFSSSLFRNSPGLGNAEG